MVVLICLALPAAADDRWVGFRSGPFEVLSSAGERSGREALAQLEQLRWALGALLSKPEPKSTWPIRVLVQRRAGQDGSLILRRDAYIGALVAGAPMPREWLRECARLLIEANAGPMPPGTESGLADFYSTIELRGAVILAGAPPPAAERTLDWARIHLLSVNPNYYGRLRVLLYNFQRGVEAEPAYANSVGRKPAEIDRAAAAYLAAGKFTTVEISGRPLNPQRDFTPRPVSSPAPEIALADLTLDGAAYEAVLKRFPGNVEALEGLGLLAARENRAEEARKYLAEAVKAGSANARVWLAYGRVAGDRAALEKAAQLNPAWAEPHFLMARQETDPRKKMEELKAAASLEPRNAAYQRAIEEQRVAYLEYEAAERRRAEEEKRRSLERLKAEALAGIRAAEARANRGDPADLAERKVEAWWEGPTPAGRAQGRLRQVDCLRGVLRLVVEGQGGKLTRLLIRDPKRVVVIGGGTLELVCGPQRAPRAVVIEYFPQNDAKLATAGEVATIEYR